MRPFHPERHELHGITVVVDTDGPETYVGVCDDVNESEVILRDADLHRADESDISKEAYVEKAAQFGVWKKFGQVVLPRGRVTSIRRLGDMPVSTPMNQGS